MGKEKLIPIFAMIVLLIGTISSIYVHATQTDTDEDTDIITINGQEYTLEHLFSVIKPRTVETEDGEKSGIALDELIIYVGVGCPACHEYAIKEKGPYQQTVAWENMQNGILTDYGIVYFPNLAHAFWVYNVGSIEVI